MNSIGTPSWKRSDIELTKMVRPVFQRFGMWRDVRSRLMRPFHLGRPPDFLVTPATHSVQNPPCVPGHGRSSGDHLNRKE